MCNTNIYVMGLDDMYSKKKDPTEVPSYFLGELVSSAVDYGTQALASGAGWVADAASTAVDWGADALSSAVDWGGDALSGLYTGADKLVGGMLPGGQAFGDGYLANLYTGADKMAGGYLPNIGGGAAMGGAGYTPGYMQAQAAFDALPGVAHGGAHTLSPGAIQSQFNALPGAGGGGGGSAFSKLFDGSGMSWDKAQTMAQLGQLGVGIYGMTQKGGGGGSNRQQYNRLVQQPGQSGLKTAGGGGSAISRDPAMGASPVGGGNVPLTSQATGKGGVGDIGAIKNDMVGLNNAVEDALENAGFPTDKNATQDAANEGLGITAPIKKASLAPGMLDFLNRENSSSYGGPNLSNMPAVGATMAERTLPMPSVQSSLQQIANPSMPPQLDARDALSQFGQLPRAQPQQYFNQYGDPIPMR